MPTHATSVRGDREQPGDRSCVHSCKALLLQVIEDEKGESSRKRLTYARGQRSHQQQREVSVDMHTDHSHLILEQGDVRPSEQLPTRYQTRAQVCLRIEEATPSHLQTAVELVVAELTATLCRCELRTDRIGTCQHAQNMARRWRRRWTLLGGWRTAEHRGRVVQSRGRSLRGGDRGSADGRVESNRNTVAVDLRGGGRHTGSR
mmetsp:Transcript_22215/g.55718  ORF Transcript_22215/g.55718 Transcript_22215/m.55718 type:complete len:204 (-) Transcript_22215:198-809(-)